MNLKTILLLAGALILSGCSNTSYKQKTSLENADTFYSDCIANSSDFGEGKCFTCDEKCLDHYNQESCDLAKEKRLKEKDLKTPLFYE